MTWYAIFFLSAIPPLIMLIIDFAREKHINKKDYYFYLLIMVIIGGSVNLIYTPIDHHKSEQQLKILDEETRR